MTSQHASQPHTASYGHCDSYFVENHEDDDGLYAQAAAKRERHQQISRLRQKALARDLSRTTAEEYQEDILDHMEYMENETMPDIHSIAIQTEIQWFMRPYLLDFLLEAHHAFKLLPETLHLAVNLLDRYCSYRVVYKRHYQLLGSASLLIAAKYGDRKERVPSIRELRLMCCSLYEDDMFVQMEWHVLATLNWIVGHPTVTSFAQLALTECPQDLELDHMTSYFTEIALYHKDFISVKPSVMARTSLALARIVLGRQSPRFADWSSRYDKAVLLQLSRLLSQPSPALARKYSSPQLSVVATTVEDFLKRQATAQVSTPADADEMQTEPQQPGHSVSHSSGPRTPSKGPYTVPVGVITPPITPDNMRAAHQAWGNPNPAAAPSTPSPPSTGEHQ